MLKRYGMYSAIVDAFDDKLKDITSGKRPELVEAIYKAMDGESVDMNKLDQDGKNYVDRPLYHGPDSVLGFLVRNLS